MARSGEPYASIASQAYEELIPELSQIQNSHLRRYFDECFARVIDYFGIYMCWACVECMLKGSETNGWGDKPRRCPTCDSRSVYQIGTFNSRASRVGSMFGAAARRLMRKSFRIPIHGTPGNTTTHDFEVSSRVAIEAKGSPARVRNPNGSYYEPGRPGMSRTDTEKKAFANARTFKQRNPSAYFGIVTNDMPARLLNYRNDVVNGVFNLTRIEEIEVLIRDLEEHVDLEALRRREFG